MLYRFCLLFLLSFSLGVAACAQPLSKKEEGSGVAGASAAHVYGYHVWWMRDTWKREDLGRLGAVFFFELRARPDGSLAETNGWPEAWRDLIRASKAARTPIAPVVTLFGAEPFETLFSSEAATYALLQETMAAVKSAGADGVHLDVELFEPVSPAARAGFTGFVYRLRAHLDAWKRGAHLSLFTPAFDHAEAFDETALARVADLFVVQGYDLHWSTGPTAGPVAPLDGWGGANWQAILERYLDHGVPRHKMAFAVPFYGYEWPTETDQPGAATRGPGRIVTYAPVPPELLPEIQTSATARTAQHGLRRDPISGSPYYVFEDEDGWYQGWFEDAESLRAKQAFVRRERLAGIALFPLGYDGGALTSQAP